jgi:hypothetical protein
MILYIKFYTNRKKQLGLKNIISILSNINTQSQTKHRLAALFNESG